eukprot:TRINITY_DN373_c0_g1_i7.p1 TRINITY_DN373_c0_g1~~TRINITY_DN373_c0_g1_i7.p1  ORF type:complete len:168 (+),score=82.92 TRINITY_DN373_c0_g1_i7:197-700(+)
MKPDWDKLMKEFEGSKTTLVADVDCTAGGKAKCEEVGIRGYPSIKYGDPADLQDYKGGRDFAALKKFAEGLGPMCSPANLDLCDDDKKKQIDEFTKLGAEKREAMIKEKEAEMAKLEADFKTFVEGLQKEYEESTKKKDADIEAIKSSGLGLLKAVNTHAKKAKAEL